VKPGLMVTDPPYGVEYEAAWRNDALAGKPRADGKIGGGARAIGKVGNDDRADWTPAWALFPGDVAYVWHAGIHAGTVADSLQGAGFAIRSQIIWAKSRFVISRGHYHWQHEPCWYAVRKNATAGHWASDRADDPLADHDKTANQKGGHSTQKPVECMRRPIVNNSSPGQAVYDPFCGSGTTIIAAETEGRICYAMELDPKYCDVIVKRWQDFTGKLATLENHGDCTFEKAQFGRRLGAQDAIKEEVLQER
jgi:DNA modification methylase